MYMVADCIYQNFADYSIIQPGQMLGYFFCVNFWAMGKKQKEKSVCIKVVIVIVDNEIQQNNKNQSGGQEKGKEKHIP